VRAAVVGELNAVWQPVERAAARPRRRKCDAPTRAPERAPRGARAVLEPLSARSHLEARPPIVPDRPIPAHARIELFPARGAPQAAAHCSGVIWYRASLVAGVLDVDTRFCHNACVIGDCDWSLPRAPCRCHCTHHAYLEAPIAITPFAFAGGLRQRRVAQAHASPRILPQLLLRVEPARSRGRRSGSRARRSARRFPGSTSAPSR
jgi:hypothetical protein